MTSRRHRNDHAGRAAADAAARFAHASAGRAAARGNGRAARHVRPRRRGGPLATLLPLAIVLAGIAVLLYPTVSNWLAERDHLEAIAQYDEAASASSAAERAGLIEAARRYNESLAGDPVRDPFVPGSGYAIPTNYDDVLNVDGSGVMGTVKIPKIGVDLPIYHGTDDEALAKGVGHISNTPLPIGGEGRHSVLTGHRGLPSAELFTRLDELGPGDLVLVTILGEVEAYRVYGTEVVLPTELDSLAAQPGRDLLTLVTCTPYGVNTHRLLVHCERTKYVPEEAASQEGTAGLGVEALARVVGGVGGVVVLVLIALVVRRRRRAGRGGR